MVALTPCAYRPFIFHLDTSVLGGYFDDEWKESTRELWRQMEAGQWRFVSSDVTTGEIIGAGEEDRERAEHYKTPLPEITNRVAELENKVQARLEKMGFTP